MGLFDKLKAKGRGIVSTVPPDDGVPVLSAREVRDRILAISGKGIETHEKDDSVAVTWSAKIAGKGLGSLNHEYRYRAIVIEIPEDSQEAAGICTSKTSHQRIGGPGSLFGFANWNRGQPVGSETVHVIAWLGPHETEGAAEEKGFTFSWKELRDPVIAAVTGAGWTYKPKMV